MIDWHFPRTGLALRVLENLFDHGIVRLAFFGRRRIGKTEFLQRDLMPRADEKGVTAFYCSFWENKDQPHHVFMRALHNALPANAIKPKLKIGLSAGLDVSAEIERAERPKGALPSELMQLAQLFSEWLRYLKDRPALIVLDEIQHLATSAQFATFAASLRTLLDMVPPSVRVVFTGSSIADLHRLFNDLKAPFFNFATVQDFPPLGREFVEHLVAIHGRITGKQADVEALWQLFERVGRNAQIITGLVQQMVLHDTADWQPVWAAIDEEMSGEEGWCARLWNDLALADKAVYLRLREGQELFSEGSLAHYRRLGFTRGVAQQALARLQNRGLIQRVGHGVYQRIVPVLDDWLGRNNIQSASLAAPDAGQGEA